MFVRIDHDEKSSLYECDSYHMFTDKDGNLDEIIIVMERDKGEKRTASVDKTRSRVGVYVMNNMGQTIDTIFRKGD